MDTLLEISHLRDLLLEAHRRYGSLHHRCVVRVSQMLDRKLNDYDRGRGA